ncbi:uncharacterized protein [Aristolochia californica]|uniref:uncharacterized protein n=1 Tax=Aristolochia californica TaxID=171875 RepID=UPI0035DBB461
MQVKQDEAKGRLATLLDSRISSNTMDRGGISVRREDVQSILAQAMAPFPVDRVGLAAFHMLGEAQVWGHLLKKEHLGIGWEDFIELYTIRFGPPTHTNPLGDLILLKQTGNVADYKKLFQNSFFTAGLNEALRMEVELLVPLDFTRAMNLARALEAKNKFHNRKPMWPTGKPNSGGSSTTSQCRSNAYTPPPSTHKPTIHKNIIQSRNGSLERKGVML